MLCKVAVILGLSWAAGWVRIPETPTTPPNGSPSPPPSAKEPPAKDDAWLQPATRDSAGRRADNLLEELRRTRPVNEVILPASAARSPKPSPPKLLLPEGSALVDRSGRLSADDDGFHFLFDEKSTPSMRVLPNAVLEMMVRTAGGTTGGMSFLIAAEVTVFEEENYLLVRLARRASEGSDAVRRPETAVTAPLANDPGPASLGPTTGQTAPPVEKVLETLRGQQPRRPVIPMAAEPTRRLVGSRGGLTQSLRPEGSPVIRRPGRVLREGARWAFVPESDHPERTEPPMRILPNQTLQAITRGGASRQPGLVYLVSGEVTVFQGENYLLARSVLRNVDLGNLRR